MTRNPDVVDALKSLTGERSVRAIALGAGMEQVTLNRQVNDSTVTLSTCVALARCYHLNLLDVIAAVGAITSDGARGWRSISVEDYATHELTGELHRRATE